MFHIYLILALLFSFPVRSKSQSLMVLTFFLLYVFLALRYDFGNDYGHYYDIHTAINSGLPSWGQSDPLYKLLNLLVPNFFYFVALTAFFYIATVYRLVKDNLEEQWHWLAVAILVLNPYLFLIHSSSFRQTIAICFYVIAINFAAKKNFWAYAGFVVVAAGMHSSAILLLPLYFFIHERKPSRLVLLMLSVVLMVMLGTPLIEYILSAVVVFFPKYEFYLDEGVRNSVRSALISSFFFFIILFNIRKLEGRDLIYGKLGLLAAAISLLTIKLGMISRFGMYFDIFMIICIPKIISIVKSFSIKILLIYGVLIILLLRYYSFFNSQLWERFYEYKTILDMVQ